MNTTLKRLTPVRAKVWISFDRPAFFEGEDVGGRVNIDSEEFVQADGVRVETRVYEHYEERLGKREATLRRWARIRGSVCTRFSQNVRVSGRTESGTVTRSFPFTVNIPPFQPIHQGGSIEYNVKGVVEMSGRPDATGETNVSFRPRSLAPVLMQDPVYSAPAPQHLPSAAPSLAQIVTREIVKVRCKSCDFLVDLVASRCPNCGRRQ